MVQTPENFHLELVHILDFRVRTLESRTPESHPLTDPMAPWVCIPARLSVPALPRGVDIVLFQVLIPHACGNRM